DEDRDRDKPEERRGRQPARGRQAAPAVVAAAPPPTPVATQRAPRRQNDSDAPKEEVAIDAQLAALEAEFVALDAPADAEERLDLLERLGRAYARLNRRRDAGLCFARAVWELTGGDANQRIDAWMAAD